MFSINSRVLGDNQQPYIIAELSANHNGSLEKAKSTIRAAKLCGAHAVKFQTYTAESMTIDSGKADFIVNGGPWNGYKLYDLYREAATPYEWHAELFEYAGQLGIDCFSTPFDESAIDLLESLNAPAYKIASFELTDLPLIKAASSTGKPLLMSTGMASEVEIAEALEAARTVGNNQILLFHCISSYPTPIEHANLNRIRALKRKFNVEVGLSDHTLGVTSALVAVALGAVAIEKHFILNRNDKGPDSAFSAEPEELSALVVGTSDAWRSLGTGEFSGPTAFDRDSRAFRRSLYFVKDLKAGAQIQNGDVRRIRPGFGLPPKHLQDVLGRVLAKDVQVGDPVTFDRLA
jgi:pseudaminic acid synthase